MGEVYLAEDQKLHRQVALKVLSAQFLDDAARAERFIREARMAAKISQSNVMAIYDMDSAKDEKSGWTNKAVEQYEKFLDIWKDADPGIASIEDAKARLTRLKKAS